MKEIDIKNSNIIRGHLTELLDDVYAVDMCVTLFEISQLFDDVYDEGSLNKAHTLQLIQKSLIELPSNLFYRKFFNELQPMIQSYILQWMSANKMEEQNLACEKSYMLRAFLFQIYQFCAMLLHGYDYAIDNSLVFQELYGEKFTEYLAEFKNV